MKIFLQIYISFNIGILLEEILILIWLRKVPGYIKIGSRLMNLLDADSLEDVNDS